MIPPAGVFSSAMVAAAAALPRAAVPAAQFGGPVATAAAEVIGEIRPDMATHAGRLHGLFSTLDELLHLAVSPAVSALLPPRYRAYAAIISVVGAAFDGAEGG